MLLPGVYIITRKKGIRIHQAQQKGWIYVVEVRDALEDGASEALQS